MHDGLSCTVAQLSMNWDLRLTTGTLHDCLVALSVPDTPCSVVCGCSALTRTLQAYQDHDGNIAQLRRDLKAANARSESMNSVVKERSARIKALEAELSEAAEALKVRKLAYFCDP